MTYSATTLENVVERDILKEFGSRSDMRIWKAKVGKVNRAEEGERPIWVQYGLIGQADISGIRLPHGQRIEIECKRPKGGRQSEEQKAFQAMVTRFGGIYIVARNVQDVYEGLGLIKIVKGNPCCGAFGFCDCGMDIL